MSRTRFEGAGLVFTKREAPLSRDRTEFPSLRPDRWLRGEAEMDTKTKAFSSLPFGHGKT